LLVRGSVLGDGPDARTAVILEPAPSPDLAPLIAAAYGLTDRERLVTELVAQGQSTAEIANTLHLSPYTVQDHLKSVFDKAGVSARGELVARLFFEHYAPRLADGTPVAPTGVATMTLYGGWAPSKSLASTRLLVTPAMSSSSASG
jgi:DNA-binding CsgD family transcriptional regulator